MKTIVNLSLICLLSNFLNAQLDQSRSSIVSTGTNIHLPSDYLRNNLLGNNNLPKNTKGSPYLYETFLPSKVIINDSTTYNAMLRYNAYNDEIEMKKDEKVTALFKRPYIEAIINNSHYKILEYKSEADKNKTGYFVALTPLGKHQFYRKDIKVFKEGKKAASTYSKDVPPSFENMVNYYVVLENSTQTRLLKLKKKNLLSLLGDEELPSFMKKEKIDLKNEKDLIKLFQYYNTL